MTITRIRSARRYSRKVLYDLGARIGWSKLGEEETFCLWGSTSESETVMIKLSADEAKRLVSLVQRVLK